MGIKLLSIFLFLYSIPNFSQNISGSVKNTEGLSLKNVVIVIKQNKDTSQILLFTRTNTNGQFVLEIDKLSKSFKTFAVEASLPGHNKNIIDITINDSDKNLYYTFVLSRDTVNELKEIVIKGKIPKFKIAKDTISFKVKEYSDGTETKIEEIIKKIPKVDVNSTTGEILYKGKSVETVTLDGDNLFGLNYTTGTKNISVDMVEHIEAIDNYSENQLLKGIEKGGKVSLNLKLKKNKTNYAGDLTTGLGLFNNLSTASNNGLTFLTTASKFKSFTALTHNNIGQNKSPFDYFGSSFNAEQQKENNFFAKKNLQETIFANGLTMQRANINDQYFANHNGIFKINPKFTLKFNLYFLKDDLRSNQFTENQYQINNTFFNTSDSNFISKKPNQYRGDIETRFNTSKTSLLEYKFRFRKEDINTISDVLQNKTSRLFTTLRTDDFYFKQDLIWSRKLSSTDAFQISMIQSFNDVPQIFTIMPITTDTPIVKNEQFSRFKKYFSEGKAIYLGSKKNAKYSFSIGANFDQNPFTSNLITSQSSTNENNFDYSKSNYFNNGQYSFTSKKWTIEPSYSLRFLNQKLTQNTNNRYLESDFFIFEPSIDIRFNFNDSSFISSNASYNKNAPSEHYFFINPVLISNRIIQSNVPNLTLQQSQRINFMFYQNNPNKQFEFSSTIDFQKSIGSFFSSQTINEQIIQNHFFFLPQKNTNFNFNFKIAKYLPIIESTVKFTTNYAVSTYINFINNSGLRQNINQSFDNTFFLKSAFDGVINFENALTLQQLRSESENQAPIKNKSWANSFKLIMKSEKKWFLTLTSDYFLPNDNDSSNNFFFIDASIIHKPKNTKSRISLNLRNISNENNFVQIRTSDVARTIFSSNLLPRHFMLDYIWTF